MFRVLPSSLAVAAGAAGCSFESGREVPDARPSDAAVDAAVDAAPTNFHARIEAWMDGRSNLVFSGATVRWHHILHAAPGRLLFDRQPTKIDDVDWLPTWPDIPDAENRDCNCDSSTFNGLASSIPRAATTSRVTIVQARRSPSVLQVPTVENNFTLIIGLDDAGPSGAAWHVFDVEVSVQ